MKRIAKQVNGFTLIEIMIVILIVSIAATLITLRIQSPTANAQVVQQHAYQLKMRLSFALQQAVLRNEQYGLVIRPQGYDFVHLVYDVFNNQWQWELIDYNRLLSYQPIPDGLVLALDSTAEALSIAKKTTNTPDILLYSSGELTPFSAQFGLGRTDWRYEISGLANGEISLKELP